MSNQTQNISDERLEVIHRRVNLYIGDNNATPLLHAFDLKLRRLDADGKAWGIDAEEQLTALRASHKRLTAPFTYSECENAHELAKSEFEEATDELIHCVDNANRYLNRRLLIEQECAALADARKLEGK